MRTPRTAARLLLVILLAGVTWGCKDRGSGRGGVATAPAKGVVQSPPGLAYETIARTYAPYTSPEDPLGFPMKVRNLAINPYRFWRGSKELFYDWCKANAAEWMRDERAFVRIHGDLHPGTIGIYFAQGDEGRTVAFGPLDFDESAKLPFQIELLQGVVTLDLLARRYKLSLDESQSAQLVDGLIDAYRAALGAEKDATHLLEEDEWVGKLLREARAAGEGSELAAYTQAERFIPTILDRTGRVRELLRPPKVRTGFAESLDAALSRTPGAKSHLDDSESFKPTVEDVVWRMQFEFAGGEGLRKYLLLVPSKKAPERNVILYLEQQIPTAAERAGLLPLDPRPPGPRAADDMQALAEPPAFVNGWCTWNNGSYRLGLKEPTGETLDGVSIRTFDDVRHMARVLGTVAGCVHRQGPEVVEQLKTRLTPEFSANLARVGMTYTQKAASDFRQFVADARTREQIAKAEAGLRELQKVR